MANQTKPQSPYLAPQNNSSRSSTNITNFATPTIFGFVSAGGTVDLFDLTFEHTAPIAETIAGSDGYWSADLSYPLTDGVHNLAITVTDSGQNGSPLSDSLSVIIDTSAPDTPTIGSSPGGFVTVEATLATRSTRPVFLGSAEALSTVNIFDEPSGAGGLAAALGLVSAIGTVSADASGAWSFTPAADLIDGPHELVAIASDAAANSSEPSTVLSFVVDTLAPSTPVAPTLTQISDSGILGDNVTNIVTPTLAGFAEAGSTVTLFEAGFGSETILGSALAGDDGSWTYTFASPLADGLHRVGARTSDAVGNTSQSSSLMTLRIDTSLPPLTSALELVRQAGLVQGFTLAGTGTPGEIVILKDGSLTIGSTGVSPLGSWSFGLSQLPLGLHTVTAELTNGVGNKTLSNSFAFTLQAPPPNAPTIDTTQGDFVPTVAVLATRNARPKLTGIADPASTINIFDAVPGAGGLLAVIGTTSADSSGLWTLQPMSALTDGAHRIVAIAYDAAASSSLPSTAFSFLVDTIAPITPATPTLGPSSDTGTADDNMTNIATPTFVGFAEAGSTMTLFEAGSVSETVLASTAAGADGSWITTLLIPLGEGLHRVGVRATDAVGNTSSSSSLLLLRVDTSTPVLTAVLETDREKGLLQGYTLAGTASPGGTIVLKEGSSIIGSVGVTATGDWSYRLSALSVGQHTVTAEVSSPAGTMVTSDPSTFTVKAPRFNFADQVTGTNGTLEGSDYLGPVSYLTSQLISTSNENSIFGSTVPNVFLHSGSGDDALNVTEGSNVLDGGAGSNFLTGSDGHDSGHDTFYIDGRNVAKTWDTLVNFHKGDIVDLFGYDPVRGRFAWADDMGAMGYRGATLQADLGDGQGVSSLVTFAMLPLASTKFSSSLGKIEGLPYLEIRLT